MRFILSLLLLTAAFPLFAQNAVAMAVAKARLQNAGAVWRAETGTYTAVGFGNGPGLGTGDAATAARAFLEEYGAAFGINDVSGAVPGEVSVGINGHTYVRFRQMRAGTRVLGGLFTVGVAPGGRVTGLAGTWLPPTFFAPAAAPPNAPATYRQKAALSLRDLHPLPLELLQQLHPSRTTLQLTVR